MSTPSFIPQGYAPILGLYDTQKAIGFIKRIFEDHLCGELNLRRVSAPLFVEAASGLNDDLNGVERPVAFDIPFTGRDAQVVHSLATWKRMALYRFGFPTGTGLVTDMNAIRRDEELDNLHSVYVDQWDWEKVIAPRDRNKEYLHSVVNSIVKAICDTQKTLRNIYGRMYALPDLREEVTYITTQELEDLYPDLTPKERENHFVKEHKTVFVEQIGAALKSGVPHDGRAPDYDDWSLNGDILFWNDVLGCAFEVSSMGSRVSPETPGAAVPQNALKRRAAPDHRRRHRPVKALHAAAGQGPHLRGPVLHLGPGNHSGVQRGRRADSLIYILYERTSRFE